MAKRGGGKARAESRFIARIRRRLAAKHGLDSGVVESHFIRSPSGRVFIFFRVVDVSLPGGEYLGATEYHPSSDATGHTVDWLNLKATAENNGKPPPVTEGIIRPMDAGMIIDALRSGRIKLK
jgi:hypothetical protein